MFQRLCTEARRATRLEGLRWLLLVVCLLLSGCAAPLPDSDARFSGLLCFTAPEAVWLAEQGFDDLLIAYPTIEPTHIEAVAEQVRAGHQIMLMVDSIEQTEQINAIASKLEVKLPLCLDLDMGTKHLVGRLYFGALRSALNTTEQIRQMVAAIEEHSHLDLDGVMGYEAQIAGVTDNTAGATIMNWLFRHLKKRSRRKPSLRVFLVASHRFSRHQAAKPNRRRNRSRLSFSTSTRIIYSEWRVVADEVHTPLGTSSQPISDASRR